VPELSPVQRAAVEASGTIFLLGPVGAGKSYALQSRLLELLGQGEPAYTLLVLVAEPEHMRAYLDTVRGSGSGPYADLNITTYSRLARELVTLFWPLVARPAGFSRPFQPPTFIGYDLAQLLMWRIVAPILDEGAFADLRMRPQQIISQILDTLNRAALNGLSLEEASERQRASWPGESDQQRHLREADLVARHFRRSCLENNLLDLSLVTQVFDRHLVQHPEFRNYFTERYRHLLVDNIEEQTPAGQNFVQSLMDTTVSSAMAYDAGGGYKRFLASDPEGAARFQALCQTRIEFKESFYTPPPLFALARLVGNFLQKTDDPVDGAPQAILGIAQGRYRHEMVARLVALLEELVHDGLPPSEIAILAPYLDGALRYLLTKALREAGLPYFILRRRSSPRDEPRVRAWLTWLSLAHPDWNMPPAAYDVAEALHLSISGLDPVRANLLVEHWYVPEIPSLRSVDELPETIVERVGRHHIELVEDLRLWLANEGGQEAIDVFLHRLFHGLLAQRRYQPEPDLAGAAFCDWLVRSAYRLRRAAAPMGLTDGADIGRTFISGINQGLVTSNPPQHGHPSDPTGLMISTVYGYLLAGRRVAVQVWLESAATGWWDIPRQPLSNAFVLARSWPGEKLWSMVDEFAIRDRLLSRIIRGLVGRCSQGVILANSDLDRRGIYQSGKLRQALSPAIQAFKKHASERE
jgi:hypothetical protein